MLTETCPYCDSPWTPSDTYCPECGVLLVVEMMDPKKGVLTARAWDPAIVPLRIVSEHRLPVRQVRRGWHWLTWRLHPHRVP